MISATHDKDYEEFCKELGFDRPQYKLKLEYVPSVGRSVYVRDRDKEHLLMEKNKPFPVSTGKYDDIPVI